MTLEPMKSTSFELAPAKRSLRQSKRVPFRLAAAAQMSLACVKLACEVGSASISFFHRNVMLTTLSLRSMVGSEHELVPSVPLHVNFSACGVTVVVCGFL